MNSRQRKELLEYTGILNKIFEIISVASQQNQPMFVYEVPKGVIGNDAYSLKRCLIYLIKRIRDSNVQVKYKSPNYLIVTLPQKAKVAPPPQHPQSQPYMRPPPRLPKPRPQVPRPSSPRPPSYAQVRNRAGAMLQPVGVREPEAKLLVSLRNKADEESFQASRRAQAQAVNRPSTLIPVQNAPQPKKKAKVPSATQINDPTLISIISGTMYS